MHLMLWKLYAKGLLGDQGVGFCDGFEGDGVANDGVASAEGVQWAHELEGLGLFGHGHVLAMQEVL